MPRMGVGWGPWLKHTKNIWNTISGRHIQINKHEMWLGHDVHQFHLFSCAVCISRKLYCFVIHGCRTLARTTTSGIWSNGWRQRVLKGQYTSRAAMLMNQFKARGSLLRQGHWFSSVGGVEWHSYPAVWAQWQHLRVGLGQLCWRRLTRLQGPKLKKETTCVWFVIYLSIYICIHI
jgi:hypothetical protein